MIVPGSLLNRWGAKEAAIEMSWRQYWENDTSVYVSARHKQVHYALIADQIRRLVPKPSAQVLDYGCGEALQAGKIAEACGRLFLLDGAVRVRADLAVRHGRDKRIGILSPEDLENEIGDGTLDLIIVNSVLQYLPAGERDEMLARLARKLAPDGHLVVADVIPPQVGPLQDAWALLRLGAANGFFPATVLGLARAAFSPYRSVRSQLGLAHYDEAAVIEFLGRAGLAAERMAENLGHNPARMAFLAQRKIAA